MAAAERGDGRITEGGAQDRKAMVLLTLGEEKKEWFKLTKQLQTNPKFKEVTYPILPPHPLAGVRWDPNHFKVYTYHKGPDFHLTTHAMYSRASANDSWTRFNSGHYSKVKKVQMFIQLQANLLGVSVPTQRECEILTRDMVKRKGQMSQSEVLVGVGPGAEMVKPKPRKRKRDPLVNQDLAVGVGGVLMPAESAPILPQGSSGGSRLYRSRTSTSRLRDGSEVTSGRTTVSETESKPEGNMEEQTSVAPSSPLSAPPLFSSELEEIVEEPVEKAPRLEKHIDKSPGNRIVNRNGKGKNGNGKNSTSKKSQVSTTTTKTTNISSSRTRSRPRTNSQVTYDFGREKKKKSNGRAKEIRTNANGDLLNEDELSNDHVKHWQSLVTFLKTGDCQNLERMSGWSMAVIPRSGPNPPHVDVYYFNEKKKKFRSRVEIMKVMNPDYMKTKRLL